MNAAKLVFYFDDPLEFLNTFLREKQKSQPRFSLRAWARQMGYQNPSMLFQVLKGERKLKMELALKIATDINLTGKSLRYFELLVLRRGSQSPTEKYVFETMLATLRPPKLRQINQQALDIYTATSDWCHWAIYAMASFTDFVPEASWIQQCLGVEVDKKTIKNALERLIRLGFLKQLEDGRFKQVRVKDNPLLRGGPLPPEALKQYQSQMIEKAKVAVELCPEEERQVKALTMALSPECLPRAKQILAEAHRQIAALAQSTAGDEVYQLNSQLFRLTHRKKKSISVPNLSPEGAKTSPPPSL